MAVADLYNCYFSADEIVRLRTSNAIKRISLQWFKVADGQQPGDPAKAAQAIIQAVESPHPPMRLALGTDAMSLIQEKLEWIKTDLDVCQSLTVSTDYPESITSAK